MKWNSQASRTLIWFFSISNWYARFLFWFCSCCSFITICLIFSFISSFSLSSRSLSGNGWSLSWKTKRRVHLLTALLVNGWGNNTLLLAEVDSESVKRMKWGHFWGNLQKHLSFSLCEQRHKRITSWNVVSLVYLWGPVLTTLESKGNIQNWL